MRVDKLRLREKVEKGVEFHGKFVSENERTNSIVLRVSRIEMARVNANWVLYRLDCGHLVNEPVDFIVK